MTFRRPAIGAAAFALLMLALPTFAVPHKDPDLLTHRDTRTQLQDVNLAEVVTTAQAAAGDGSDALPTSWCGNETGGDNPPVTPAAKAQFKVVYAYAADRANRFAEWKDALQANVAVVQRFLSAQDGGTKAIRFDMGTSCGPQYVDIQSVQLPGARAAYADNFSAISNAVKRVLGEATGPRNAIVLADGLSGSAQEYGLGETMMGTTGERPGSANVHNSGKLSSILFTRDGAAAPGAARWGWWPEGFLHEMTHNLGAVQWGAPHSTQPLGGSSPQYGHCWQGADVMCYAEEGGAAHAMQQDCAGLPGAIPQNYDCGRDDYFNPAPAVDSYLATHWNTYDSAFLAPCGEIAPACGGGSLWVPGPPAATTAPSIAGSARRGQRLTAGVGVWSNSPTGYAYQWQRLIGSGWENIAGATGATYTAGNQDLGRRLRVAIVASNEDGSAGAASEPSASIGASGVNRAATSTSRKGRQRAAAQAAKASKKRKTSAKQKAAARRKSAKPATKVRH